MKFYKKRKFISTKRVGSFLLCDEPTCDFTLNEPFEGLEDPRYYVNVPCPKCSSNLLTMEDYKTHKYMMEGIAILNFLFSWTTVFINPNKEKSVTLHAHNGIHKVDKIEV